MTFHLTPQCGWRQLNRHGRQLGSGSSSSTSFPSPTPPESSLNLSTCTANDTVFGATLLRSEPNPGVLRLALFLDAWGGGGGGGQSLFLSFSELLEALYIPWLVDPY